MQGNYGRGKPAPMPIFNHRKRPRQAMFAEPSSQNEAPTLSHDADLMPVGGFQSNQFNSARQFGNNGVKKSFMGQSHPNQGVTGPRNRPLSTNVNDRQTSGHMQSNRGQQERSTTQARTTNAHQGHQYQGYRQRSTGQQNSGQQFSGQQYNNNAYSSQHNNPGNGQLNSVAFGNGPNQFTYGPGTKTQRPNSAGSQGYKGSSSFLRSESQYNNPGVVPSMFNNQLPAATTPSAGAMFNRAVPSMSTRDVQSFGPDYSRDNPGRAIKPKPKKSPRNTSQPSLRVLTASLDTVIKSTAMTEQLGPHMFEVYGVLDSAVVSDKTGTGKEFILRDQTASLHCVFYEIDRNLPRLIRGQWQRCVGTIERKTGKLKCVSVRAVQGEERLWAKVGQAQTEEVLAAVGKLTHEQ